MFDVKPMDKSGNVAVDRVQNLKSSVNLRGPRAIRATSTLKTENKAVGVGVRVTKTAIEYPEPSVSMYGVPLTEKAKVLKDFEQAINDTADIHSLIASVGGSHHAEPHSRYAESSNTSSLSGRAVRTTSASFTPRPPALPASPASNALDWIMQQEQSAKPVQSQVRLPEDLAQLVARTYTQPQQEKSNLSSLNSDLWERKHISSNTKIVKPRLTFAQFINRWAFSAMVFTGLVAFVFWLSYSRSISIRNNVLQNGGNAVANLEKAKEHLAVYHFGQAADSFALAYDDLNKASGTLSKLGSSITSVFGNLPGFNKINAANNLIDAGQSISKAGENLALAFNTISNAHLGAYINFKDPENQKSLAKLMTEFRDVLAFAKQNITSAHSNLASIDASAIPEDKQPLIEKFNSKIPEFDTYIGNALDYSDFLLGMIGTSGEKRYLLMFQNNTELRPTGGFPGSYALITFKDGTLKNIAFDDIYNIDGQIAEKIIPPIPLQHITPTWGMRDANWFADFPTSAKKIEEMYVKDGGQKVDGVIAMTPDLLLNILKITGPIPMPEYGLTLSADNFMEQVQAEIEYGENRAQPKTILKDLLPKFMLQLATLDKDKWTQIADTAFKEIEHKNIIAYFNDPKLEKFTTGHAISGKVGTLQGDYLQVVLTNVKGSKTDALTDTSFSLQTKLSDSAVTHTLDITRVHNGGDKEHNFYNKVNPDYVRVYAPKGASFIGITGQSITDYKPLVDYRNPEFKKDSELADIENTIKNPLPGIDVFQEGDNTVFGFWLVVKPHNSQTVTLSYSVPTTFVSGNEYTLSWQKQAGTTDIMARASFDIPEGKKITKLSEGLKQSGSGALFDGELLTDQEFHLMLN